MLHRSPLCRRVDPLVAFEVIGGSSYGAVAALYALLTRPDLFSAGLIASPSLAIGNGQLLRDTDCSKDRVSPKLLP